MTDPNFDNQVLFASFWNRAGAYIIDGFIVGIFIIVFNVINIANFQSFFIYLPVALIGILYKPFMESKYGATFGKMALDLKVTDYNLNQIDFTRSFIRSLILILPAILTMPFYFLAFNNPVFQNSMGLMEFTQQFAITYPLQGWISYLTFLVITVDIILFLTDPQKTNRSLHDRIARTYVIKSSKSTVGNKV